MRITVWGVLLGCTVLPLLHADDYSEATLLYQQAQDVLREASGGQPDPVKYANAIKQLEQAEALAEKATAREPDKAERLLQDISGARFWAQKFATTQAASALRGEKITPPPSSPAKPAAPVEKTPPPADAKPAAAALTGDLAEQADQLMRDGKMKEAGELWMKALDQLAKDPAGADKKVALQARLGNYFFSQGMYNEALKKYQEALAANEKKLGPGNALLTADLKHVGETLFELAQYKNAEPILLRAVNLSEKFYGAEHPECARVRELVCKNYISQRKLALAQNELTLVDKIRSKVLKPQDPELAQTFILNGMLAEELEKFVEAHDFYKKAADHVEKTRGADHPSIANCLWRMGRALGMGEKSRAAVALYRQALALLEKSLVDGHPAIGSLQRRLGRELIEINLDESEELLNKSQKNLVKAYGPEHMELAYTNTMLGQCSQKRGNYDEGDKFFMQAVSICQKNGEKGAGYVPNVLNDLGVSKMDQKKFPEAEKYFKQAIQYNQAQGFDGVTLCVPTVNLAVVLARGEHRYNESYPYYQSALDLCEKAVGSNAPRTRNIASQFYIALREAGKTKEAEALRQKYNLR